MLLKWVIGMDSSEPNNTALNSMIETSKMVGKEGIQSEKFLEELSDG